MIESAAEFIRLRSSDDPDEYRRAAHEPAPLAVWRELVEHHPAMRFWVVHNKQVPLEILRLLAEDPDPRVRSMVADKRKLDQATFEVLAGDADAAVRARVARNAKAPTGVLERLAGDPEPLVRDAVAARTG
jgi:hypothetical protein